MATIVILQHSSIGTPGRLGMTLRDHGFRLDIRRVDLPEDQGGHTIPTDLDNVGGVVALGGPQNASDSHPWLEREREFLRAAHEAELPVVGICLGHQLLAQALGGEAGPMETPEIGFHDVQIPVPGQTDVLLAGVPWGMPWYQNHGFAVTKAPPGSRVLMENDRGVQMFAAGLRTMGFQFHFEATRPMIDDLTNHSHELMTAAGTTADEQRQQTEAHYDRFAVVADRLCLNIVANVFPFERLLSA